MDLSKTPMFLYQRRLYNKGHLNLTTEVPKKFSPDVFNRLRVTHSKSSDKGNFELKSDLKIFSLRWFTGNVASLIFLGSSRTAIVNSDG